jgi:hypothetical protein
MQKAALILAMAIIPFTSTPASAQFSEIVGGIERIIDGIEQLERESGDAGDPNQPQEYPQSYHPQSYPQDYPQDYPQGTPTTYPPRQVPVYIKYPTANPVYPY